MAPPELPSGVSFEHDFQRLYAGRFDRLFRFLDRLSGDPALAADTAQEAFLRLYRRGEMPLEPSAWLVSVALNLLRDERRRAGRRLRLLTAAPDRVPAGAPAGDPAADLESRDRVAAVRAALDRLSPRDREALLLRHAGYSYREIAQVLELAEGSVGTTLLRAGESFRRAFKEMHGAPE